MSSKCFVAISYVEEPNPKYKIRSGGVRLSGQVAIDVSEDFSSSGSPAACIPDACLLASRPCYGRLVASALCVSWYLFLVFLVLLVFRALCPCASLPPCFVPFLPVFFFCLAVPERHVCPPFPTGAPPIYRLNWHLAPTAGSRRVPLLFILSLFSFSPPPPALNTPLGLTCGSVERALGCLVSEDPT